MTKKTIKPWGAALLAGTILAMAVAPAQATSPGPDWYVVNQVDFESWQPTPPGADWVLVGQRDIDEWQPFPDAPGQGYWKLAEVKDRRYFLADGAYQRKLESSVTQQATDADGIGERVYGPDEITQRTPGEKGSDIKVPYKMYVSGGTRTVTKLVRYERWEDQDYLKPWTRFFRFKDRTRSEKTFRFEWKDPITNETMKEIDPNVEYTAWVYGNPYNNGIESQGKDPANRRVALPLEDREELHTRIALGVSAIGKADADRPGSFKGDAGSGGKAALQAGKLRETMGANQVKASAIAMSPEQTEEAKRLAEEEAARQYAEEAQRKAEEEAKRKAEKEAAAKEAQNAPQDPDPKETTPAALTLDKVLGNWASTGGKSNLEISQVGKSNEMKVKTHLVLGKDSLDKTLNAIPFGQTWQGSLGKDKLGATIYLKATFNEAGTEMSVKIWRDALIDSVIAEGKFTKKK